MRYKAKHKARVSVASVFYSFAFVTYTAVIALGFWAFA